MTTGTSEVCPCLLYTSQEISGEMKNYFNSANNIIRCIEKRQLTLKSILDIILEKTENLDILQDCVEEIITDDKNKITGVKTALGIEVKAGAVVLTTCLLYTSNVLFMLSTYLSRRQDL